MGRLLWCDEVFDGAGRELGDLSPCVVHSMVAALPEAAFVVLAIPVAVWCYLKPRVRFDRIHPAHRTVWVLSFVLAVVVASE